MPSTFFLVRTVVAPDLHEKFDHWYSTDHLPWACRKLVRAQTGLSRPSTVLNNARGQDGRIGDGFSG
jgi:hypothetical protein